jgi:hypothetical protein
MQARIIFQSQKVNDLWIIVYLDLIILHFKIPSYEIRLGILSLLLFD